VAAARLAGGTAADHHPGKGSFVVTPAPLLQVDNLTMRFGGLVAINDLSLTARQSEITAIIGPNGAGKTTFFNCLTGFYKPTSGSLTLTPPEGGSWPLHKMQGFRIAKTARVARTFQNIRLFAGMTVLENLLVAQHNRLMRASRWSIAGLLHLPSYRHAEDAAVEKARQWLARIGLEKDADTPAGSLPYGAQRRLEIARAMCSDPVLLCLDEPAAGLNPRESLELNDLLLDIRAQNRIGLLLIEHDMSVVMKISDHVVVLDYGARIADGPAAKIRHDPAVIRAYLGADEDDALPIEIARDLETR
jgi:branched-chain amino acid transport system ATP-binding protein